MGNENSGEYESAYLLLSAEEIAKSCQKLNRFQKGDKLNLIEATDRLAGCIVNLENNNDVCLAYSVYELAVDLGEINRHQSLFLEGSPTPTGTQKRLYEKLLKKEGAKNLLKAVGHLRFARMQLKEVVLPGGEFVSLPEPIAKTNGIFLKRS